MHACNGDGSMTIEIPKSFVKRLQGLRPHFCLVEGKNPNVGGKGWQKPEKLMSAEDPKLQAWLKRGKNYGVVCGYGLVVIEADHEKIEQAVEGNLPPTFAVLSPGHERPHFYFLCSMEDCKPLIDPDNKGENIGHIKAQGGMVVGPGSIHPDVGKKYEILHDRDLEQVSPQQVREALRLYIPEKQINRVNATVRWEKQQGFDIPILDVVSTLGLRRQGNEFFWPHPVHGSETARNFWVNPSRNCWHCFRHGAGGGPLLWLAVEEGIINCEDATPGVLRGPLFKRVLEKARERGLIEDEETPINGSYFDSRGKFIPKLLADDIMRTEQFITLMSREIYIWRDGYYQPLGEIIIEQRCEELLQQEFRKHRFSEVAEYIRASTFTIVKDPPGNLVNLENGVLDTFSGELTPSSSEYHFLNKLPLKYDPDCKGEKVHKFLREVTGSEEDARVLEEIVGYCLYRGYPYHKALALVGEGANGKSTFLALVKEFLGRENVSGKGLVDLEINRFAKASLFGKLSNLYADLSDETLQRTGTFKMLTGGDVIEAEKKFKDSFTFVNYAKLLFSCNKLPQVYDNTDAFFRRWIIIVFPKVFRGANCDPNILEKLTAQNELSGLLNIALKGLKRILENDGFSRAKSTEETREDYIRKSDPLAAFVMDCIEESQDFILLKQRLYSLFAFYCRENNLPAVNKDTFFKNISKHVTVTQIRVNRKDIPGRPYGFKGVTLTELGEKLWSKQSNQSRVSHILLKLEDEITRNNKIGKTLDSSDWLDHKQVDIDKAFCRVCHLCHKNLPEDGYMTTVVEGKTVHLKCYRQLKAGRKP